MNTFDAVGHIAEVILLTGTLLVGQKIRWGWLVRICGGMTWLVVGLGIGMSSIWVWASVFCVIEFRNFLLWSKDAKDPN